MKAITADTNTIKYIESLVSEISRLTGELGEIRLKSAKLHCAIEGHLLKNGSITRQDYTLIYLREVMGIQR